MTPPDPIVFTQFGDLIWLRVEGKGCFQNSPMLKEFCVAMVERGALKIVVDLENCPVMDSTFMGVLSGIACRLADKGDEGTLSILFNCAVVLPFVFIVPWRYVAKTFIGTREPFRAATAEGSAA